MNRLCLTLADPSPRTLTEKLHRFEGTVPLIEVRLDHLEDPRDLRLPRSSSTEFIATLRPQREGGLWKGAEELRLKRLEEFARAGFQWVDLEWDVDEMPRFPSEVRVIRSRHFFDRFPRNLTEVWESVRNTEGAVAKLAVPIGTSHELVLLLEWMENHRRAKQSVVLGMGEMGKPSRVLGGFLGNAWTYVAERSEKAAAPGLFSLREARSLYRLDSWESVPLLYGVLGNPVKHSLSPLLHNHLFRHYRQNRLYLPLLQDDVNAWLDYVGRTRLSFYGFSVTLPFKTEVLHLVLPTDLPLNALNTLTRRDTGWEGLNTDLPGFIEPLKRRLHLAGKRALLLGNGGVAHTVVTALQQEGVYVTVAGRNRRKLEAFAAHYGCPTALLSELPLADRVDLCVNTTPVGQYPNVGESPLSAESIDFDLVYDLIYSPEITYLLETASQKGVEVLSGMEMFVEQAALQFESWTGIAPDRQWMTALIRELNSKERTSKEASTADPAGDDA